MVYKIAIGRSKQLFQTWKTGAFMNATLAIYWIKLWIHTLWTNAMANSADWLQWSTLPFVEDTHHIPQGSSAHMNASQRSVHLYGSNHELTFRAQCSGTEIWLSPPGHLFTYGRCSTTDQKVPRYLKQFRHGGKSMFWSFLLDQSMNKLSEPTAAVHSSDWLHLDIFPPIEDTLPWTTRIFDIWKTTDQHCHEHQSAFWPVLLDQNMSKHVLHKFWAHYNADRTPAKHLSTHDGCSTADHRQMKWLETSWYRCQYQDQTQADSKSSTKSGFLFSSSVRLRTILMTPISVDFWENIHALTNGGRKQTNQTQNGDETKGDRAKKLLL